MRSYAFLIAVVLAAAMTAACPSDKAIEVPTFDQVMARVIEPRCVFSSCHGRPTVAAQLDLTAEAACRALVDATSCLFAERTRVVPNQPENSFLLEKLVGQGLTDKPTAGCSDDATTNLPMPFGAKAIDEIQLALVRDWIAAGAECERVDGGDGGVPPKIPKIASFTAELKTPDGMMPNRTTPLVGDTIRFTVKFDKPTPEGGQKLVITTDTDVLSVATQLPVPAAQAEWTFTSVAMRPASRFTITVQSGESTQKLVFRITGLEIAEVMTDPSGADDGLQWIKIRNRSTKQLDLGNYQLRAGESNYNLVVADLTSYMIPAGGCAVIGGPTQSSANGAPNFTQLLNFAPDLPHMGTQAAGFALFDRNAMPVDGITTPVDTMLVGAINNSRLIGPDAEIASPYCSAPIPGMSARRTDPDPDTGISSSKCEQAQMQPNSCN